MYDIKNLNIWKESSKTNIFLCKEKVLTVDGSKREETVMSDKSKEIFMEISRLVPDIDLMSIKRKRGGKLRFPIYINDALNRADLEVLDLSMRSSNCLHRAGYRTVGELVEGIETSEDLKRIRNCGAKSVDEIMDKLFCYQYSLIEQSKRLKYINRVIELNKD